MKRLCVWIFVFLVASVWCAALSASDGQGTGVDSVLKLFPGYHVLTLQERDPNLKAYVVQQFPKANPSVVHADFDGDGQRDYALLLKNDELGKTILVVALCPADGQCKSVYNLDVSADSSSVYILPVPVESRVSQTDAIPTSDHSPDSSKNQRQRLRHPAALAYCLSLIAYCPSAADRILKTQKGGPYEMVQIAKAR
jgi:hypothetical protein